MNRFFVLFSVLLGAVACKTGPVSDAVAQGSSDRVTVPLSSSPKQPLQVQQLPSTTFPDNMKDPSEQELPAAAESDVDHRICTHQRPSRHHLFGSVAYSTNQEKALYRQGIALTCNGKPWHSDVYSNTAPSAVFVSSGVDLFSQTGVVRVTKSPHALARLDISVTPLKTNGQPFASLEEFLAYATTPSGASVAEGVWRVFRKIADAFPLLRCGGYRIAADNQTNPLALHMIGGEALSKTFLAEGQHDACSGVGRDTIGTPYHALNPQLGGSFNSVFLGGGSNRYETAHALSFDDISPQVDVHLLVIPKGRYVSSYEFAAAASREEIVDLLQNLRNTVMSMKLSGTSFRIVTNAGYMANQTVSHMHIHVGLCNGKSQCGGKKKLAPLAVACAHHRMLPSNNLHDMVPFVDHNTVATFDVDDVLLLDPYYTAMPGTSLRPAARETKAAVAQISSRTSYVLGLTARNYRGQAADTTVTAVSKQLGFAFKGFNTIGNAKYQADASRGFYNGVMFTNNLFAGKGAMLVDFLNPADPFPTKKVLQSTSVNRVIFVDDRKSNCASVHSSLQNAGTRVLPITQSISFYYTGASS